MIDLYGLTRSQLTDWIAAEGFSSHHVPRLWRYLYRDLVADVAQMSELPVGLVRHLQGKVRFGTPSAVREATSVDGQTHKYLLRLDDDSRIEAVLMRCGTRATACVSSQVGCALGCVFCATGLMGWERNLTTAEITAQAVHVVREASRPTSDEFSRMPRKLLDNIVLMGMGEPLLNYDAVLAAVEILSDPGGLAVGLKQITLSTVGIVPGIVRLADERRGVSLAVSLHSADQDERAALIPVARTWPLTELMHACRYYAMKLKRRIFFEWTLIADRNDSADHAHALVRLLSDIPAQVNLIPLNPVAGFEAAVGSVDRLTEFREVLAAGGVPVSIRRRRGVEIDAGCGQLAAGR